MNTHPAIPRFRPAYLLFALITLMMLVVINRDRVLLDPQHPVWEHYRFFKWWLLPHGVVGALALCLASLQFSTRLRQRHLRLHRYMGRVYVCAVAAAAPFGIAVETIQYLHGIAPLRLLIGSSGLGLLFAITTGTGFLMARRGNISQHKRWMTRSYAVALVFLETRCVDQLPWLTKLADVPSRILQDHSISDLWMDMAFSLLAAELVLHYQRAPRERPAAVTPELHLNLPAAQPLTDGNFGVDPVAMLQP